MHGKQAKSLINVLLSLNFSLGNVNILIKASSEKHREGTTLLMSFFYATDDFIITDAQQNRKTDRDDIPFISRAIQASRFAMER